VPLNSFPKDNNPQIAVILGTVFFFICGISIAVIASTSLSADDYVNYIAFVSFSGIVVLGLGSALEQESTLLYFRVQISGNAAWRYMLRRIGLATIAIWLLFLLPIYSWQQRLFGGITTQVQIAVVIGAPGLLLTTVARGFVNGQGRFLQLSKAHFVFGASTLVFPVILYLIGSSLVHALIFGQVIAWSMPLLVLFRRQIPQKNTEEIILPKLRNITIWLISANFFLIASINSTNLILRKYANLTSNELIAEAQLLVTVSCLASTFTLGLLPFIIGRLKRSSVVLESIWEKYFIKILITLSFLFVLSLSFLRKIIIAVLSPRDSQIDLISSMFLTIPAFFWTVSLVLSAKLIVREKIKINLSCWIIVFFLLWFLPSSMNIQSFRHLALMIFIVSFMSALIFLLSILFLGDKKLVRISSDEGLYKRQVPVTD
jgi:hypothetical protein